MEISQSQALAVRPAADPEAVREHLAGNPAAWALCRELGHSMSRIRAGLSEAKGAYESTLRCSRCKTKKHQVIDSVGVVIASEYEYPDGYLLPEGTGRIDSAARGAIRTDAIVAQIQHQNDLEEQRQQREQQRPKRKKAS